MSMVERNKVVIREFTHVFKNEHNVDGIDHLFARDFRHNFRVKLRPGLDGFKDIGRMMNGAFPDVVVDELDLVATEDRVVERSHARGTHKGDFMGAPGTGRRCEWWEIHVYRMADGKIAEHWVEMSMLELVSQVTGRETP